MCSLQKRFKSQQPQLITCKRSGLFVGLIFWYMMSDSWLSWGMKKSCFKSARRFLNDKLLLSFFSETSRRKCSESEMLRVCEVGSKLCLIAYLLFFFSLWQVIPFWFSSILTVESRDLKLLQNSHIFDVCSGFFFIPKVETQIYCKEKY